MTSDLWHRRRTRIYLFFMGLKRRMTLGARAVLVDGERIYLIRHTYAPGWHLPGGGVEPGETAEASVGREILEESGYRLTGRPELFGFYHNCLATNRDHVALYVCRQFEPAYAFKANFEIAEFGWFARTDLPADTSEATRRRIAEVFDGATPAAEW
jgi:ADP-ribose pyrophosphatase YjhB (NUDIX family)